MRVRQLCGMLTALHSLAGGIAEPVSFLALSRFSVGLCESRDGYIVAVLADPGVAHRESVSELARVVARAFARAGGSDLPDLIHADTLDAEERADAHTVHDDLADSSDEPRTWDRFASFHDEFLVPALETRARPTRWLEPVAALPDILRVHLLTLEEDETSPNEAPETESPDEPTNATRANATRSTLSLPGAAASHPLAALAGVGATGALWTAVKRHAAALIASAADRDRDRDRDRTDSASDSEVLAFDDVVGCAGAILRVAMRTTPHPGAPRGYAVVAAFSASSPRARRVGPSHVTAARDASAASAFGSGSGSGSESPSRSGSSTPARAGDEDVARSGGGAEGGVPALVRRDAFRRGRPSRVGGGVRGDAKESGGGSRAESGGGSRAARDEGGITSARPRDSDDGEGASDGAPIEATPPLPAREVHAGSPSDRERAAAAAEARARARTRRRRGARRRRPRRRRPRRSKDSAPRVPSASPWRRPGTPMVTGIRTVTHTGTSPWRCWRYQPRGVARNRPFVLRRGAETPETFSRRRVRRDRQRRTNPRTGGRTNGVGHATRASRVRVRSRVRL